jgi:hypothetical protein
MINGTLRDSVLVPALGSTAALPISGITLAAAVLLLSWLASPWYGVLTSSGYGRIGILWLVLTLIFEFGFGRFVAGKSWPELFGAYDVASGNLWVVVLLATLLSPWIAARLRGSI